MILLSFRLDSTFSRSLRLKPSRAEPGVICIADYGGRTGAVGSSLRLRTEPYAFIKNMQKQLPTYGRITLIHAAENKRLWQALTCTNARIRALVCTKISAYMRHVGQAGGITDLACLL